MLSEDELAGRFRYLHSQGVVIVLSRSDLSAFPLLADTSAVHGSYFLLEVSWVMVRGFFQINVPFYNVSLAVPRFLCRHYRADLVFCYRARVLDPYSISRFEFLHQFTSEIGYILRFQEYSTTGSIGI